MMGVDTSFLDLIQEFVLVKVPAVITIEGLECTACP
jgi:hypothetical protein